jgi:hypothetical protein
MQRWQRLPIRECPIYFEKFGSSGLVWWLIEEGLTMAMEDNDDRDYQMSEQPAAAGGTTQTAAPPQMNLDAAMAALIKAATPAEAARRATAISSDDEDDGLDEPDFGILDEEAEMQEVDSVAVVPEADVAQQFSDFMQASQAGLEAERYDASMMQQPPQQGVQQQQYEQPRAYEQPRMQQEQPMPAQPVVQQAPAPQPMPQQVPQMQEQPAPPAPMAQMPPPQPMAQQANRPANMPRPGRAQAQEPPRQAAPASAPPPVKIPFSKPVEAQMIQAPEAQQAQGNGAAPAPARGTKAERYLFEASRFIYNWLMENQDSDEVLIAATQWVKKHDTAEHNALPLRGVLEIGDDPQVVLIAVRWLTEHTDHELAPEIVEVLAGV